MAITAYKTWIPGEVLTASDLNASFSQIINNAADLISPFTKNIAAGSFKITGLAAATANGDAVRYEQLTQVSDSIRGVCDFRLSLTSGTAVTTGDVTAAETLYAALYTGNRISLYDGSAWVIRSSVEMSIDIPDVTGMHDVFCYDDSGTPTLEVLAWTNDTTRATALTTQDGILVKSGQTTRRYLGSFYCTTAGNGQTEDSVANRYVWNYYNRVLRPMRVLEATDSWVYNTATTRQANGSTANRLNFCVGVSEDSVSAEVSVCVLSNSGGLVTSVGIGLDTTSAFTTGCLLGSTVTTGGITYQLTAFLKTYSGVGKHYLSWNERAEGATTTWTGDGGNSARQQAGIHGEIWA